MRSTISPKHVLVLLILSLSFGGCALDPAQLADVGPTNDADSDLAAGDNEAEPLVAESPFGRCLVAGWLDDRCDEERACQGALRCVRGFCALESREGEPCDTSGDCVSGFYCRRHDDHGREMADPRCALEVPTGGDCVRLDLPCANGLRCIEGHCQARSALSQACAVQADCGADLTCDYGSPDGPSCELERRFAEACDDDVQCGDRLRCLDGVCAARGRSGDPCAAQSNCQPGFFCDRLHGDGTERITAICKPEIPLWGVCDPLETSSCTSPGHCLWGRCLNDLGEGEDCERSSDCLGGLYCGDAE